MAEMLETRYIVVEHDKITLKPKTPKLVTNLNPFRKRFAPFASESEFVEDCEAGITKRYGLEVRVATEADLEKHGGDPEIHKLADAYGTADERAKREKREAAHKIIPFLSEKIKSTEDLANALVTYNISTMQVMAMAKDVRQDGVEVSDEFVNAYCQLVSDRSKKTGKAGKQRSVASVRKAWDAERKAEVGASSSV